MRWIIISILMGVMVLAIAEATEMKFIQTSFDNLNVNNDLYVGGNLRVIGNITTTNINLTNINIIGTGNFSISVETPIVKVGNLYQPSGSNFFTGTGSASQTFVSRASDGTASFTPISITESQISDLQAYLTSVTGTNLWHSLQASVGFHRENQTGSSNCSVSNSCGQIIYSNNLSNIPQINRSIDLSTYNKSVDLSTYNKSVSLSNYATSSQLGAQLTNNSPANLTQLNVETLNGTALNLFNKSVDLSLYNKSISLINYNTTISLNNQLTADNLTNQVCIILTGSSALCDGNDAGGTPAGMLQNNSGTVQNNFILGHGKVQSLNITDNLTVNGRINTTRINSSIIQIPTLLSASSLATDADGQIIAGNAANANEQYILSNASRIALPNSIAIPEVKVFEEYFQGNAIADSRIANFGTATRLTAGAGNSNVWSEENYATGNGAAGADGGVTLFSPSIVTSTGQMFNASNFIKYETQFQIQNTTGIRWISGVLGTSVDGNQRTASIGCYFNASGNATRISTIWINCCNGTGATACATKNTNVNFGQNGSANGGGSNNTNTTIFTIINYPNINTEFYINYSMVGNLTGNWSIGEEQKGSWVGTWIENGHLAGMTGIHNLRVQSIYLSVPKDRKYN